MIKSGSTNLVDEMYTEEARYKSFKNWPFNNKMKCSAANMAEAGFFHAPSEKEPDSAQCYVCFKELDGWDANDDPWDEHLSHSKNCIFAKLRKPQKNLTSSEFFEIEAERKQNKIRKLVAQKIAEFRTFSLKGEEFANDALDEISDSKNKKKSRQTMKIHRTDC